MVADRTDRRARSGLISPPNAIATDAEISPRGRPGLRASRVTVPKASRAITNSAESPSDDILEA